MCLTEISCKVKPPIYVTFTEKLKQGDDDLIANSPEKDRT